MTPVQRGGREVSGNPNINLTFHSTGEDCKGWEMKRGEGSGGPPYV